jgi:hypothetical protein
VDPDATIELVDNDIGLSFDGLVEADTGRIIDLNNDDDNDNGYTDLDETSVPGEDDLADLHLSFPLDFKQGATIELSIPVGKVRLWTSATKGSEILPNAEGGTAVQWTYGISTPPSDVWVEVIQGSDGLGDLNFVLADSDALAAAPPRNPTANAAPAKATGEYVAITYQGRAIGAQAQDVIVGQPIHLVATAGPAELFQGATYRWSMQGKVVLNYIATNGVGFALDPYFDGPDVTNYWVDGGNNRRVGLTITGGRVGFEARGALFNVKRPNVRIVSTTVEPVTAEVTSSGLERIQWTQNLQSGITFSVPNFPAQQFPGQLQWIQIIDESWDRGALEQNGSEWLDEAPSGALDTSYPYASGAGTADSPGAAFEWDTFSDYQFYRGFRMYLMYKQDADSIWVPLRSVDWYVMATAEELTPGDGENDWTVTDYSHSNNPADEDATVPPEWEEVA